MPLDSTFKGGWDTSGRGPLYFSFQPKWSKLKFNTHIWIKCPIAERTKFCEKFLKEQIKLLKPLAESVITSCTRDVERDIVTRGAHRAPPVVRRAARGCVAGSGFKMLPPGAKNLAGLPGKSAPESAAAGDGVDAKVQAEKLGLPPGRLPGSGTLWTLSYAPGDQCCGSRSTGSTCFWASWIRIH
jgi:hypothetical protein